MDRTFYSGHGVQITRDDLQWIVSTLTKSGEKSKTPGETVIRNQTYHATLAQACAEAAQRVADTDTRHTLEGYTETLRGIVGELLEVADAQ
jgi:hypothetical protein